MDTHVQRLTCPDCAEPYSDEDYVNDYPAIGRSCINCQEAKNNDFNKMALERYNVLLPKINTVTASLEEQGEFFELEEALAL